MNLLELLKKEQEAKMTEGSWQTPLADASGKSMAQGEAPGGADTAPGEQERRTGEEVTVHRETAQDHAITSHRDTTSVEHPPVAQDPVTVPGRDVLPAEHAAAKP